MSTWYNTMTNRTVPMQARLAWWLTVYCTAWTSMVTSMIRILTFGMAIPNWEMATVCAMARWQIRLRKRYMPEARVRTQCYTNQHCYKRFSMCLDCKDHNDCRRYHKHREGVR